MVVRFYWFQMIFNLHPWQENVFHPPVERRKVLLKSDSVASVPIGRRPQSAERLHATPTKQADQVAAEPWSPTTNLKVLIQAAGPDMRDREMRKVLFRPIENKYEGVALDDPSQVRSCDYPHTHPHTPPRAPGKRELDEHRTNLKHSSTFPSSIASLSLRSHTDHKYLFV